MTLNNLRNIAGSVAQAVMHLPSKCESLSSNPRTAKKKHEIAIKKLLLDNHGVDHTSKLNIVYSRHISCKIFFCLNTTSM
jgi:hypothetical protein